jgi:hypothetical protein
MFTRRRPSPAVVVLLVGSCIGVAFGQSDIVVDASGSMGGYAQASGSRLRGLVERLHGAMSASGPNATRTVFVSQTRDGANELKEMPLKAFAAAVASTGTYRGNTPLQWTIEQERQKSDEFVLITDGMESGARLGGLISALNSLASSGWGLGLAATPVHFKGIYYTEMELMLGDDLPKVEAALAGNPHWQVAKADCVSGTRQNCYYFDGERPLLFLMFSKSGDLDSLFRAVSSALKENQLNAARALQLSPFRPVKTITEIRAVDERSRRLLVLPDLSQGQTQLRCLANQQSLSLEILNRAEAEGAPPQPSEIHAINVKVPAWPTWARRRKDPSLNGRQTVLPIEITCDSSLFDRLASFGPYVTQRGTLELSFEQVWSPSTSGWWLDWDAMNPWQYPNKVYKLAEIVNAVHKTALERANRTTPPTTKLTLTAVGPR